MRLRARNNNLLKLLSNLWINQAAIDINILARHETRHRTGQKPNHLRNLLRRAIALNILLNPELLRQRMAFRRHHIGSNRARSNDIDRDALGPQLLRPPKTHRVQRALGAGIKIAVRAPVARHDAADTDDASAWASEVRECCLHEEEGAADIGLEHPVEAIDGMGGKVLVEGSDAGVVDDDVDSRSLEGFEGGGDEVFAEGFGLLVDRDGDCFDAEGFDSLYGLGGCGGVFAVVDDDLGGVSLLFGGAGIFQV